MLLPCSQPGTGLPALTPRRRTLCRLRSVRTAGCGHSDLSTAFHSCSDSASIVCCCIKPTESQLPAQIRSIWLLVYPLMGYASWRIYNSHEPCAAPLILYAALLLATWLCWPPLVSYKRPAAGLLDCLGELSCLSLLFYHLHLAYLNIRLHHPIDYD